MTTNTTDYETALDTFTSYILEIQSPQPKGFPAPSITIERGRKYDRVVLTNPHKSAFCFIRKDDGAVLKCDGYKRPAKHARGTIFTSDGRPSDEYGISEYGPHYL